MQIGAFFLFSLILKNQKSFWQTAWCAGMPPSFITTVDETSGMVQVQPKNPKAVGLTAVGLVSNFNVRRKNKSHRNWTTVAFIGILPSIFSD
jgi:hypothetical protein